MFADDSLLSGIGIGGSIVAIIGALATAISLLIKARRDEKTAKIKSDIEKEKSDSDLVRADADDRFDKLKELVTLYQMRADAMQVRVDALSKDYTDARQQVGELKVAVEFLRKGHEECTAREVALRKRLDALEGRVDV